MHEHGEQFRASWIQSFDRVASNIRLCDLSKEQDTGVFLWAFVRDPATAVGSVG